MIKQKKFLIIFIWLIILLPLLAMAATDDTGSSKPTGMLGNLQQTGQTGGYQTLDTSGSGQPRPVGEQTITNSIIDFLTIVFQVIGLLFLILTVYAGFRWMTAGGNEEQVTEARKLLINAVIGLAIILFSYAIVLFAGGFLSMIVSPNGQTY